MPNLEGPPTPCKKAPYRFGGPNWLGPPTIPPTTVPTDSKMEQAENQAKLLQRGGLPGPRQG